MISYIFSSPLLFVTYLVAIVVVTTIHEFAHAYTTDRLGDPTPRLQGRVTLNPRAHIDPYGLLFLLFVGFGWGKPVMFDLFNLQHPRRDAALISLAGPLSNFILALILAILLWLFNFFGLSLLQTIGYIIFAPMIHLNIIWGVFNLLPIHPLDGFKIVGGILPVKKAREWFELERYGYIFLLLLIIPFFGSRSMIDLFLRPLTELVLFFLIPHLSASGVL